MTRFDYQSECHCSKTEVMVLSDMLHAPFPGPSRCRRAVRLPRDE